MPLASWQLVVLRWIVKPLLSVAGRLQLWSMMLTSFCHGLMLSMAVMQHGGMPAIQTSPGKNGQVIMTESGPVTISEEQLNALAFELLKGSKPPVFH